MFCKGRYNCEDKWMKRTVLLQKYDGNPFEFRTIVCSISYAGASNANKRRKNYTQKWQTTQPCASKLNRKMCIIENMNRVTRDT